MTTPTADSSSRAVSTFSTLIALLQAFTFVSFNRSTSDFTAGSPRRSANAINTCSALERRTGSSWLSWAMTTPTADSSSRGVSTFSTFIALLQAFTFVSFNRSTSDFTVRSPSRSAIAINTLLGLSRRLKASSLSCATINSSVSSSTWPHRFALLLSSASAICAILRT